MRVPLSAIAPDPTVLTHFSFKIIGINNRSTILASMYKKIYLLKLNQDADGDRIPDDWEEFYGMNPLDPSDALEDDDEDGSNNLSEFQFGGDPTDDEIEETLVDGELRDRLDTDADGLPDAWERKFFPNLTLAQVIVAGNEDHDSLNNGQEWQLGTDPTKRDTDRDGISDSYEIYGFFTDPTNPDSDEDGLVDGDERRIGTNALDPTSTGAPPTFLNIAEKVTTSEYGGVSGSWANWRYTGPDIHEGSPTCGEYASSHAGFSYPALSDNNPVTMLYPEGEMPEVNPDNCTPASPYNTDGFLGGGIPWNTCGSLRSWKVRAERKTTHPSIATQAWLVVESDIETGTVQNIRTLQLEIDANEKVSDETEEIKPSGNGKKVTLVPVVVRDIKDHSNADDDVTISNWDTTHTIEDNNIAWIEAHQSVTDATPRMPQLEFNVPELSQNVLLEAKLLVEYERPYAGAQADDTVRIPADGSFRIINNGRWPIWNEYANLPFFGGDATLTYRINGGAERTIRFAIGGRNPEDARCKTYTQGRPGAPWYAYAMEKHESEAYNPGHYNQFWERSGNSSPINNGVNYTFTRGDPLVVLSPGEGGDSDDDGRPDSVGGAGLAQVTGAGGNPPVSASREIFWNWQKNVDSFVVILAAKIQIAESFMNDPNPRSPTNSMPNGQRPQTTYHTGNNVPVPSRVQGSLDFGDNQGERRPEDAVAIKAYNGATFHWCSWAGPASHNWQFNYGQNNYVEEVCNQIEEVQP